MTAQGKKLLIAGGGTGGHIFPAVAIAEAWEAEGGEVLFVGTTHGMESRIIPKLGKPLALLKVGQIKGKTTWVRLHTLFGLPVALYSAWTILNQHRPDVVLGMGGYVSAPTVLAAHLMGLPTALHEQNARVGMTNRLLGKVTDRVFISFSETSQTFSSQEPWSSKKLRTLHRLVGKTREGLSVRFAAIFLSLATRVKRQMERAKTVKRQENANPPGLFRKIMDQVFDHFTEKLKNDEQNEQPAGLEEAEEAVPSEKVGRETQDGARVCLTGNPIRTNLHSGNHVGEMLPGNRPFRLLVFGGSQGARVFGDIIPPTIQAIRESGMPVQVRQQASKADLERVRANYQHLGIPAEVEPFIQNMGDAYREADLVICRSGATTVAELASVGKPALFVPYPFAADDHQTANARAMVRAGGGWMRPQGILSQAWLVEFLLARMADPEGLFSAGHKAQRLAKPEAAKLIVENLLQLAAKRS